MKKSLNLLATLLVLILANSSAFTQNFYEKAYAVEELSANDIAETIINDYSSCIEHFEHDKIYLNSNNIHVTKNGPILMLSNDSLPLPNLGFDSQGSYISLSGDVTTISVVRCIGCGWPRFSGEYCQNPDCPLSKK